MKAAMLRSIEAWQQNPNRKRGMCLQTPTCSAYGHHVINRYGVVRGGIMTTWRIFKCNGCMSNNNSRKVSA
jgi:putative component of membrane protein insertase Oxa1/YidC/SpoIIIJ protein YidD